MSHGLMMNERSSIRGSNDSPVQNGHDTSFPKLTLKTSNASLNVLRYVHARRQERARGKRKQKRLHLY